jgi:hypothetical protein
MLKSVGIFEKSPKKKNFVKFHFFDFQILKNYSELHMPQEQIQIKIFKKLFDNSLKMSLAFI